MFRKHLRHISRYREIASILASQGFGYLIEETDIIEKIPYHEHLRIKFSSASSLDLGERICTALQELGPTYIKLGQMASTRQDLLPHAITIQLEKLQDDVRPFSFDEVQTLIKAELGDSLENIFSSFDRAPLATASIGQVHLAQLKSGERVAVKLQRPGIIEKIETDLEILFDIATAAQNRLQWAKDYQLVDIIDEFSNALLKELDYAVEGRNAEKMKLQLKKEGEIHIPEIYWEYSSKKILTMEFISGIKVNQIETLKEQGFDCAIIAKRFAENIFQQIFINGCFHGDPHPGNILVLPDNVIAFLDFGMTGHLSSEMKRSLSSLLIGFKRNDTNELLRAVLRIGIVPGEIDTTQLKNDIELFRDTYYGLPLSKISIHEAINQFFAIARKHSIRIPSDLILVCKSLLTVESIVKRLDTNLSLVNIIEPFSHQLLLERLHPSAIAESLWNITSDFSEVIEHAPQDIRSLRSLIRQGHLQVRLSLADASTLFKQLAQLSNRISVSIILLAFSILMGSIIISFSIMGKPSALWNLPVIEAGICIAFIMFLWVLYAIFRSGKL